MNRNEEYFESMRRIKFSDETKNAMAERLMKVSAVGNGGFMKKKINMRKAVIVAAACVMAFGVTAAAAGVASGVVSHNRIGSRTSSYSDLEKLEKKVGLDVVAVESFENGYTFDHMDITDSQTQDEDFNALESYSGIDIIYADGDRAHVFVDMSPAEYESVDGSALRAQETAEIDGIAVYYNRDEYLILPATEGSAPTEEEALRQENDDHFYISYGSDKRETNIISSVIFEMNNVVYDIMTIDGDLSADEMFKMAEEIIKAR